MDKQIKPCCHYCDRPLVRIVSFSSRYDDVEECLATSRKICKVRNVICTDCYREHGEPESNEWFLCVPALIETED